MSDLPEPVGVVTIVCAPLSRSRTASSWWGYKVSPRSVLVATGKHKAEAVHHLVEGAVSAMWPGSVLQLHPHVTVVLDDDAACRLQLAPYFRETYEAKPDWQEF